MKNSKYLKREIDLFLDNWKKDNNRKPLIIGGARQVGKTASIEHHECIPCHSRTAGQGE